MIREAIAKLIDKKDLKKEEIEDCFEEIMTGEATPGQIGAFLTALRLKGETVEEITGAAIVMRAHATKVNAKVDIVLDTCGTGGDVSGTFNISTISAFVAAGAGAVVAKHGNRSVSSMCGSADLLMALGINIELNANDVERCIQEIGIGFLYAPLLHGAMMYATPVRKEIGIRTIFNILGPLTNPAGSRHQLLGVYDERLTDKLALVLKNLGSEHALVVHGKDGLDEVTTTADTVVSELKKDELRTYRINPKDFGIKKAKPEDLKGKDPKTNAKIATKVLKGEDGPQMDIVLLNTGCALYACDIASSVKEGIERAKESIKSGKALQKLNKLIEISKRQAE